MRLLLKTGCNEISYEGKWLLSLFCLTKRDTDRPEMHVSWIAHGRRKSVLFSKGRFFVCHFIHHDMLTPVIHHSHYYYLIVPSKDLDFQRHMSWSFYGQWIEVRGGCSFCWYWWNYWLSLFKLSFHKSTWTLQKIMLNGIICIINILDIQLLVQSVYIITKVVSSNPDHVEVYSIQHCLIKFVSDLRQVCGFLRVLRCPPPLKLTATI